MTDRLRKDAFIVFLLLAFLFAYFFERADWNQNSRFGMIFSVVEQGHLYTDSFQQQQATFSGDDAYFNGHYYSDKAIGPALLGIAFYAPMYWASHAGISISQNDVQRILIFLVIGIPSALAGSFMYILCLYLSRSRLRAFLVMLAVTLGTMYFPFATVFFSHQFTASLLFIAFVLIFFLKEKRLAWKKGYSFLIGTLLGWAFISEYPAMIIVLPLAIYFFYALWKEGGAVKFAWPILLLALGAAIPVLFQMIYNRLCYGSMFSFGYQNLSNPAFNAGMSQGLAGLGWPNLAALYYTTLHPQMGLFWQSPVLLLFIPGAVFMLVKRQYRLEAILALWIIASTLIIMSGYYMWWGGSSFGPRFLIMCLPFFSILLVFVPRKFTWPGLVLGLVSIGQMVIVTANIVAIGSNEASIIATLGYFQYSVIYNFSLPQLLAGNFAKNLGQRFLGLHGWPSLVPFLFGAILGLFFFLYRMEIRISAREDFPSRSSGSL